MAAVDLGAQSGRVAHGSFDGERLTISDAHRFANEPVLDAGVLRWDVRKLYDDAVSGLRLVARDTAIDSVAVDSWAVDFGLVDRNDRLLENPVHYRDTRRAAAFVDVLGRIAPRELYARTGIQLLPINTLFELAALAAEQAPALSDADRLYLIPDLFHHWLCGSETTELTNATTTQCFDPVAGAWAGDLLERLGIPAQILPEIVAPGTPLGPLSVEGLNDAVVVAVATHDTGSAVAGAPLAGRRSIFLSVGTWSLVGIELDEPLITDAAFEANLTNEGGADGTTRLLRNVNGLWLLHECRRAWADAGVDLSYDELVGLAREAAPFGALIDPNAEVFSEPGDMPDRVARYCHETNQQPPADPAAVARCIFESLALKHAESVDVLQRVADVEAEELCVLGGGARNDLLCQWTADASGIRVAAGHEEATLIGNLLVQAMALGELDSLEDVRTVVRDSFPVPVFEPSATAGWAEARERFAALDRVEVSA